MSKRNDKVERGRSGADLPPAMQEKAVTVESREDKAHSADRPTRISMSNMKKLEVPESLLDRDKYYYRWFQGKEGRISQALAASYEHVTTEGGDQYTRQSGPYTMHLMRLPIEFRLEDEALKRAKVAATLDNEAKIGHNEYAPTEDGRAEGGTSALSRHTSETN